MTVIFTPGYAPFEQYTRDTKLGPWTDLYAVGATLFSALTGRTPAPATDRMMAREEGRPDPTELAMDTLSATYPPNSIVLHLDAAPRSGGTAAKC